MWRQLAWVGLLLCAAIQWCPGAYGAIMMNHEMSAVMDTWQIFTPQPMALTPPLGRRIAELFGGILVGFPMTSWGLSYIDKDRPFLGTCLFGGGILAVATGMFLWWAIQIPATWGWPV